MTEEAGTCDDTGTMLYTCYNCGKTRSERIEGKHSFGEWQWEYCEYTYKSDVWPYKDVTRKSHKKYHDCTACGYREYANIPDHICEERMRGAEGWASEVIREATCTQYKLVRWTCPTCGWQFDLEEGLLAKHVGTTETIPISEYTETTDEMYITRFVCDNCGLESVKMHFVFQPWHEELA